jgi:hypothetical protein
MSWRVLVSFLLCGCNALAGLDDLAFTSNEAASSTSSSGGAGGMPGNGGEGGEGGDGGCVPSAGNKRVFVTSDFFTAGRFGGLRGADGICQAAADGISLGGCWRAWLSDAATAAPERICPGGPWHNMRGAIVASDCGDLLNGDLQSPIGFTQNAVPVSVGVWTGADASGAMAADCLGWTSEDPAQEGLQGVSDASSASWTASGVTTCNDVGSFYCFEL